MTRAAEGTLVSSRTLLLAQLCWEASALGSRNSERSGLWAPVPPLPLASAPSSLCLEGSVGGAARAGTGGLLPRHSGDVGLDSLLTQMPTFPCRYRAFILLITFLIYTCYHMSRKPISVVKVSLARG